MSQELTKEELITFLQRHNITYNYNPVYEGIFGNDYLGWIESNTDHMLYLFDKYHRKLEGLTYTMIIKINEIEKKISGLQPPDLTPLYNQIKECNSRVTETEKYGRILADVYVDEIHINKWMLDNKHAVKYNGGTKIKPPEWEMEE